MHGTWSQWKGELNAWRDWKRSYQVWDCMEGLFHYLRMVRFQGQHKTTHPRFVWVVQRQGTFSQIMQAQIAKLSFELWKKVCDCTTYRGNATTMGLKRAKVWATLDELVRLLEKAKLSQEEISSLKTLIGTFTQTARNSSR